MQMSQSLLEEYILFDHPAECWMVYLPEDVISALLIAHVYFLFKDSNFLEFFFSHIVF